jgi:type IV secretory pathway TrbF-like protein
LGQFLQNIRNIPLDPVVFRQNWDKSYAYLTPEAANKMNQQMKVDNPLQKLTQEILYLFRLRDIICLTNRCHRLDGTVRTNPHHIGHHFTFGTLID